MDNKFTQGQIVAQRLQMSYPQAKQGVTELSGGGGGGTGTVTAVNTVLPDITGNVTITGDDIATSATDSTTIADSFVEIDNRVTNLETGGGGTGTVISVNSILPDVTGNVTITGSSIAVGDTDFRTIEEAFIDASNQFLDLQTNVLANSNAITNLQTDLTNLQGDVTILQDDLTNLETSVTNLETSVTNIEQSVTALEDSYNNNILRTELNTNYSIATSPSFINLGSAVETAGTDIILSSSTSVTLNNIGFYGLTLSLNIEQTGAGQSSILTLELLVNGVVIRKLTEEITDNFLRLYQFNLAPKKFNAGDVVEFRASTDTQAVSLIADTNRPAVTLDIWGYNGGSSEGIIGVTSWNGLIGDVVADGSTIIVSPTDTRTIEEALIDVQTQVTDIDTRLTVVEGSSGGGGGGGFSSFIKTEDTSANPKVDSADGTIIMNLGAEVENIGTGLTFTSPNLITVNTTGYYYCNLKYYASQYGTGNNSYVKVILLKNGIQYDIFEHIVPENEGNFEFRTIPLLFNAGDTIQYSFNCNQGVLNLYTQNDNKALVLTIWGG